jgi:hypothetical protein
MIGSGYYLVLMLYAYGMWGIPTPYPDAAQCEAAGRSWKDATSGRYQCVPAPVEPSSTVNRMPKRDAWPLLNCRVPDVNAGPAGTPVCGAP